MKRRSDENASERGEKRSCAWEEDDVAAAAEVFQTPQSQSQYQTKKTGSG